MDGQQESVVLFLFQRVLDIIETRKDTESGQKAIRILDEQRSKIYHGLAKAMGEKFYLPLNRSYGILLYTPENTNHEEQKIVLNFITNFQLKTIRRIVQVMQLHPEDLGILLPQDIAKSIFKKQDETTEDETIQLNISPSLKSSLQAVYNYVKRLFQSRVLDNVTANVKLVKLQIRNVTAKQNQKVAQILKRANHSSLTDMLESLELSDTIGLKDNLARIEFDTKMETTKILLGSLNLKQLPIQIHPELRKELFGSSQGSESPMIYSKSKSGRAALEEHLRQRFNTSGSVVPLTVKTSLLNGPRTDTVVSLDSLRFESSVPESNTQIMERSFDDSESDFAATGDFMAPSTGLDTVMEILPEARKSVSVEDSVPTIDLHVGTSPRPETGRGRRENMNQEGIFTVT